MDRCRRILPYALGNLFLGFTLLILFGSAHVDAQAAPEKCSNFNCFNGIDDDGNGLVDFSDPGCDDNDGIQELIDKDHCLLSNVALLPGGSVKDTITRSDALLTMVQASRSLAPVGTGIQILALGSGALRTATIDSVCNQCPGGVWKVRISAWDSSDKAFVERLAPGKSCGNNPSLKFGESGLFISSLSGTIQVTEILPSLTAPYTLTTGNRICYDGKLTSCAASETCGDGLDNNCNGLIDEGCPVCGNGIVEGSEQCDDGNIVSGDGCSANCTLEKAVQLIFPVCGNGILEPGEECDDGNIVSNDGCSAACTLENSAPIEMQIETPDVPTASTTQCQSEVFDCSLTCSIWSPFKQVDAALVINPDDYDKQVLLFTGNTDKIPRLAYKASTAMSPKCDFEFDHCTFGPAPLTSNTSGSLGSMNPIFSPDGSKIAFRSSTALDGIRNGTATGSTNIWIMKADGTGGLTALTQNSNASLDSSAPVFPPDGKKIAFASRTALNGHWDGTATGSQNIWIVNADGTGGLTALTQNSNYSLDSSAPVFSPDGTKIAFQSTTALGKTWDGTGTSSYNIWIVNADGTGGLTSLTQNSNVSLNSSAPVFSPDGSKIAFYSTTALSKAWDGTATNSDNIWIINANGTGGLTALTQNSNVSLNSSAPVFSPDGTKIAFNSFTAMNGSWNGTHTSSDNIWIMNAAADANGGTGRTALTQNSNGGLDSSSPIFSPDGSKIAFYSLTALGKTWDGTSTKSYNIWIMNTDGMGLTPLTSNTNFFLGSRNPIFSPDSSKITFDSVTALDGTWNGTGTNSTNLWIVKTGSGEKSWEKVVTLQINGTEFNDIAQTSEDKYYYTLDVDSAIKAQTGSVCNLHTVPLLEDTQRTLEPGQQINGETVCNVTKIYDLKGAKFSSDRVNNIIGLIECTSEDQKLKQIGLDIFAYDESQPTKFRHKYVPVKKLNPAIAIKSLKIDASHDRKSQFSLFAVIKDGDIVKTSLIDCNKNGSDWSCPSTQLLSEPPLIVIDKENMGGESSSSTDSTEERDRVCIFESGTVQEAREEMTVDQTTPRTAATTQGATALSTVEPQDTAVTAPITALEKNGSVVRQDGEADSRFNPLKDKSQAMDAWYEPRKKVQNFIITEETVLRPYRVALDENGKPKIVTLDNEVYNADSVLNHVNDNETLRHMNPSFPLKILRKNYGGADMAAFFDAVEFTNPAKPNKIGTRVVIYHNKNETPEIKLEPTPFNGKEAIINLSPSDIMNDLLTCETHLKDQNGVNQDSLIEVADCKSVKLNLQNLVGQASSISVEASKAAKSSVSTNTSTVAWPLTGTSCTKDLGGAQACASFQVGKSGDASVITDSIPTDTPVTQVEGGTTRPGWRISGGACSLNAKEDPFTLRNAMSYGLFALIGLLFGWVRMKKSH